MSIKTICSGPGVLVLITVFWWVGQATASPVLFSDNFDTGASSAWGNERGAWRDTGGVYDAANPTNNPLTYTSVTTLPGLTDFAVDVDINDLDDGGIWLRSGYNSGNINGVLLVTGGDTGTYNGLYWHTIQNGVLSGVTNRGIVSGLQGGRTCTYAWRWLVIPTRPLSVVPL